MRVAGTNHIGVARQQVWDALTDPAVLARTLPGCESLEVVDTDTYRARVTTGVASVRGTYDGTVSLSHRDEPCSLRLHADGAGTPGTIGADVDVRLHEADEGTEVAWEADAVVGGMIGGVGQRMLAGVSARMAREFFDALERDLVTGPPTEVAGPGGDEEEAVPARAPAAGATGPARGQVYPGQAPAATAAADTLRLLGAFVLGAAVALAGVLVGRRTR